MDSIFIVYFVELCIYITSNVSDNVQTKRNPYLYSRCPLFCSMWLTLRVILVGEQGKKLVKLSKCNMNEILIHYFICEHFRLSH